MTPKEKAISLVWGYHIRVQDGFFGDDDGVTYTYIHSIRYRVVQRYGQDRRPLPI